MPTLSSPPISQQLDSLCRHLRSRRAAILESWRQAVKSDPDQETARSLTRTQFNDHVPQVLDAFDNVLRSVGIRNTDAAESRLKREEVKHGIHRWQQGYKLQELVEDWGHLQLCLFAELEEFAAGNPDFQREALHEAKRQMMTMVNESISASAAQYDTILREEAAGHVAALKYALDEINAVERKRSTLIHHAVHDIRNGVSTVRMAANLLGETGIAPEERVEFTDLIDRSVQGVAAMLADLMELARLEAGMESRAVADMDAAALIVELCDLHRPYARQRGLFLNATGVPCLPVEGDANRIKRLLQNLLVNALKYTGSGGVSVSWGEEEAGWWLKVEDTGPGFSSVSGSSLVSEVKKATACAKASDAVPAIAEGASSEALSPAVGAASTKSANPQQEAGEGVGLSIVKRLCELLDASLEMSSSAEEGTMFRVALPRTYQKSAPAGSESRVDPVRNTGPATLSLSHS